MIALALALAFAQDGSTVPPSPVPPDPSTSQIIDDAPVALTLAPKPSPIRRVKPSGPTSAKYFENGGVVCKATIAVDAEGKAQGVTMTSTEDVCPKPFQNACERSLKFWKFLPAHQDGRAVPANYDATVTFNKDGSVDGADAK
jgi:hypothetical protein